MVVQFQILFITEIFDKYLLSCLASAIFLWWAKLILMHSLVPQSILIIRRILLIKNISFSPKE